MQQHRGSRYHPGITMHAIPINANAAGLIFTLGTMVMFLVGVPLAASFFVASLAAGAAVAVLLRRLHRDR